MQLKSFIINDRLIKGIHYIHVCLVTQLHLTLCDPMDCSPPGASVHGILQARTLQWVAIPFSGDPSNPVITLGLLHYGQILTV